MLLSDTIEVQRRQVSVLFVDIVGFTAIAERIGEESSFRVIQVVSARLMEAVHEQGGSVQEFRGDGLMALFGAPNALEDAPIRACRAALTMQQMMSDLGNELERDYEVRPVARVGIHAGQLVFGEVGDDQRMRFTAIGDAVNLAARLESEADGGSIFISDTLYGLVKGQVNATDVGLREIKGKARPQQIFRLDGLRDGVTRFDASRHSGLTQLLERDPDLARLQESLERARKGGVQIAHVVGEAGIGKSRLMHEFRQMLGEGDVRLLQGDCRADGITTPFLPFVDLLRSSFGIKQTDDRQTVEAILRSGLDLIGFDVAASLPYLMALLGQDDGKIDVQGLGADVVGMRIRQLLLDLLWDNCKDRTVVLFVEDLHWIDPGSEELLNRIAHTDQNISLLLVLAFRPYYQPPWEQMPKIDRLKLEPLSHDATVQLLSDRLGVTDLGSELVRLAVEKIEGNPLYAEEIAKFLQERRGEGSGPLLDNADLVLPANLQNLVMDRFDRLSRDTRTMLQAASVAGRKFSSQMVRDLVGLTSDVNELLGDAVRQELVLPIQDRDADYSFKHALVQDAIYDTLMAAQRRRLHADVALAIERANVGRTEDVADTLAYHFELSSLHEKAVRYLAIAGQRSLNIFSLKVANDSFERAIDIIDTRNVNVDDETYASILKNWLETRQWTADFGGTATLFEPKLDAIKTLKNTRYYPHILGLLGTAYVQLLRFEEAESILDEAMSVAESRNDVEAIADASIGLMGMHCVRWRPGSSQNVKALADRILATDLNDNLYYRTYCRFFVTWAAAIRGDFDLSLAQGRETAAMGRRENYPGAVGFGLTAVAYNETFLENYDAAIATAAEGSRLSGGYVDKLICDGIMGLAMALSGDGKGGYETLRRIRDELEEKQYLSMFNIVDMPMGVAMALMGDLSDGTKWIEESAERYMASGNAHGGGMAYNALGEVYLQMATSKEKPTLSVVRKNLIFLIRTVPFAKSKALKCFEKAAEIGLKGNMYGLAAMALLNKASALKASGKPKPAQEALDQARDVMQNIQWQAMSAKIDTAMAELT